MKLVKDGYKGIKDWTIKDIDALNESDALILADDIIKIKGHNIYFVDFGGYFGFSVLVFNNKHHIYYANDYELHHNGKTKEELKNYYIEKLNRKLFEDDDFSSVENYDDYESKRYYLQNYYMMRYDYVSAFQIFHNEEEKKRMKKAIKNYYHASFLFAYFKNQAEAEHIQNLMKVLEDTKKKNNDSFDYWKDAFYKEMCNHEYGINWQGDYDVFSVFGNVRYAEEKGAGEYMNELKFNEVQKLAFSAARAEYFKNNEF